MVHEYTQINSSVAQLREDLRKRVAEVETSLSSKNRNSLLGSENQEKRKPGNVDGKEAATRLRSVNATVGQILNRGQVILNTIFHHLTLCEGCS